MATIIWKKTSQEEHFSYSFCPHRKEEGQRGGQQSAAGKRSLVKYGGWGTTEPLIRVGNSKNSEAWGCLGVPGLSL